VKIDLGGKAAVVTGGGRGIGLAITRALVECGARVVAADLDPSAAAEGAAVRGVLALATDLAVAGGPEGVVQAALREFGRLHVLVNNVGVCHPRDGFFLASDLAKQITGSDFRVDGGQIATI
jgi:NAD(P)-dependent dehydrogenase (short-subunit alcohol dehydrogenase family)